MKPTLTDLMLRKSADLKSNGQIGSAGLYKDAANSIQRYCDHKKIKLSWDVITVKFLEGYEKWMLVHGRTYKGSSKTGPASETTIGMYLRNVRFAMKQAVDMDIIKPSEYPFAPGRYVIPSSTKSRQARSITDIQKIMDYTCQDNKRIYYRDMWVFSYLCNGINMADLAALKWEDLNLDEMTFEFTRQKSTNTKRTSKEKVQGVLMDKAVEIIDKWGTDQPYVFPVFNKWMGEESKRNAKVNFISKVNKTMSEIGQELGLTGDLRTYVARHTFANVLMQSEAPIALISKALGHSRLETTSAYLGRFTTEKQRSYMSALVPNNQ